MSGERRSFADNRNGNTVAEAIRAFAAYQGGRGGLEAMSIATGYFDLGGFGAIEDVLAGAPGVRLLLGAEPRPPLRRVRLPGEPEPEVGRRIGEDEDGMRADRDFLPFSAAAHDLLARFLAFLARPEVEVRRYTAEFLHGKAFVFGDEAGVLAGSANFTRKGLTENRELVIGQYGPEEVHRVRRWFDELWSEAQPYDLAAIYQGRDLPFEPYDIYLRMLLELYGEEFADDQAGRPGTTRLPLAEFQRHGTQRALRILDNWHGVLLADGVGLGKTYMAGEIIAHYARERGQRVLVVSPAGLRGMWQGFLLRQDLAVETRSYQELATDRQVGDAPADGEPDRRRPHLQLPASDYRLVVVDEAHAFRNPDTLYYRALRRLMAAGGLVRHLVLLTATPVNNSLWDLYHQVMLFGRHDAAFARLGIPYLREFFKAALALDLAEGAPRHLFPLLNAVSVRRTRHHIQRYYPGEVIETEDGPQPIRFPSPHLLPVGYSFEALLPGFFAEVADAVDHTLTMARYRPDAYRRDGQGQVLSQDVLAGLLRSQLLKRFESSIAAFRSTLASLIRSQKAFLGLLATGWVPSPGFDPEDASDELDDAGLLEQLAADERLQPAGAYDTRRLRADIQADLDCLRGLLERAETVPGARDPKLQALWRLLAECGGAQGDARKVVVFSYYADTVAYIARELGTSPAAAAYAGRTALTAGSIPGGDAAPYAVNAETAAFGFAPRSSRAPAGTVDAFDLLLTTDVLAEGQNLQQCGQVVNFDLPWNPMRLAQRNGRVDRIGSPHDDVYLHCFLPTVELDRLLNLEQRLRRKIAEANAAMGVESAVLPGTIAVQREFGETRRRIEAVAAGDSRVLDEMEEEIDAFAGEVFRDELRRALMADRLRRLKAMPWGAGSGIRRDREPGVLFAARIGTEPHWRFVPLPGGSMDANVLAALDRVRCRDGEPRYLPDAVRDRLFGLWEAARTSIYQDYQRWLDPAVRQAAVPLAQREAVAVLRRVDLPDVDQAVTALSVPWPRDIGRRLRAILRLRADGASDQEVVERILHLVEAEGLRGPSESDLPPPIGPGDIALVCYQAVSGPNEPATQGDVSDSVELLLTGEPRRPVQLRLRPDGSLRASPGPVARADL